MIPARFALALFGFLLSGAMSLIVSGIATWRAVGAASGFVDVWAGSWLSAWIVAFPAVLVLAPLAQRAVRRLAVEE